MDQQLFKILELRLSNVFIKQKFFRIFGLMDKVLNFRLIWKNLLQNSYILRKTAVVFRIKLNFAEYFLNKTASLFSEAIL